VQLSNRKTSAAGRKRRGKAMYLTIAAIGVFVCIALAAWFMTRRGKIAEYEEYLTATVWKGPYDYAVIEQGLLESGSNTEIRCQVRTRGSGTAIIDVIPEGTTVKPGDILVELDSSNFTLEENAQKILVSTRQSQLATAENNLRAAEIAKKEYLEGLYLSQEKQLLSELFLAEQAKATAESGLESAKALHIKLIVTGLQVEAAHAALEDAVNKYQCAKINLDTLRNLTRQKEVTLLEASIASATAEVKAQQQSLRLEEERLKEIQDQIAKCTIKATAPGQVVYANETDYRGGMQFLVAPGATVRERQVIIWLPNANDMQVKATVNEARVTMVRPGMPVSVRVDALKDELLEGVVTKVNQFAEQTSFFSGSIRKYASCASA
jgi:HlyD family secretion protein